MEAAFNLLPSEFPGREFCRSRLKHEISLFESREKSPHWVPARAARELKQLADASLNVQSLLAKLSSLARETLLLELERRQVSIDALQEQLAGFHSAALCWSIFTQHKDPPDYKVETTIRHPEDWQEHEKRVGLEIERAAQRAQVKPRPQRTDDLHVKRLVFQAVSIWETATGEMPPKWRPAPLDERKRPLKSKSYFFVKECLAAAGKKKPDDLYPFIAFAVDALTEIKRGYPSYWLGPPTIFSA